MKSQRKNLGGQKRGRKKSKYGKMVTVYLSNESIAKLKKLSGGKQSQCIEDLITQEFTRRGIDWDKADKEVQEILGGGLTEHKSYLINNK